MKEKSSFLVTAAASMNPVVLPSCTVRPMGLRAAPAGTEGSRRQWRWGRVQGLPTALETASIAAAASVGGVGDKADGAPSLAGSEMASLRPDCVESIGIRCAPRHEERTVRPATATEPRRQEPKMTDLTGKLLGELDAIPSPNGDSDRRTI